LLRAEKFRMSLETKIAQESRKSQQLGILSKCYKLGSYHKELLKPNLQNHRQVSCYSLGSPLLNSLPAFQLSVPPSCSKNGSTASKSRHIYMVFEAVKPTGDDVFMTRVRAQMLAKWSSSNGKSVSY
jgi:hypothetical protein